MNASEEDIQASAAIVGLKPKSLLADTAHHFRNRTVLQVNGNLSGLEAMATGSAPVAGEGARFVSLLTEEGHLGADLYMVQHEGATLVDVHGTLADAVVARLESLGGVTDVDRTAGSRWRIFGELPDQRAAQSSYTTIRFADGRRRELGARVLRDASEPEGIDWRHARKWDGHAMRLGLLPDHRCVLGKKLFPAEAGYHRLLGASCARGPAMLDRRVLPVRIEPTGASLPDMIGAPVLAGATEIGRMLDHEGVCGIALITLDLWRQALGNGERITCMEEPALINWPSWLAAESEGRFGPAANLI